MLPRKKISTRQGAYFFGGAKVGRRSLSSLGGCATANYRLRTSVEFLLRFLALCVLRIGYTHLDGRGSRLAATQKNKHPTRCLFFWWSCSFQIRTQFFFQLGQSNRFSAVFVVKREHNFIVIEINAVYERVYQPLSAL